MTAHSELFAIAVCLMLAVLLAGTLYSSRRLKRRNGDGSLETLLARLVAMDRYKVSLIASAYDESASEAQQEQPLEGWQMWELIGGLDGFEKLVANCDVLVDLACYVQQWYPEALPIAEQLRLNAREVRWHLERLKGAEQRGHLQTAFPEYVQRAAAVYVGMTQNVLALFEASQVPGWTQLQAAL